MVEEVEFDRDRDPDLVVVAAAAAVGFGHRQHCDLRRLFRLKMMIRRKSFVA